MRNSSSSLFAWEVFFKYLSVPVSFFISGSVNGEGLFSVFELFITDHNLAVSSDSVSPFVTNTVGKLFFLSPKNFGGNKWFFFIVESLSQNIFFDLNWTVGNEFFLWVDGHSVFNERSVKERRSGFESPSKTRFIGSE
jgi:hypothetical protein